MTLFLNLMIVLILYFGAYDAIAGNILTGDIIAFIQYSTQVVFSFIMLGGIMIILPRFLVSARRVAEVLNMELSLNEGLKIAGQGCSKKIPRKHTIIFLVYEFPSFTRREVQKTASGWL